MVFFMRLDVQLHPERTKEGVATIIAGGYQPASFRCYGKSDNAAAIEHGNPRRDPLLPFGDIPTGEFDAVQTVAALPATSDNLRSYGPGVRFVLNGIAGAAATAVRNGRFGILIHGGATGSGSPVPLNSLRPTHGCLRVDDSSILTIAGRLAAGRTIRFPVTVREVETFESAKDVARRYGAGPAVPAISAT